MWPDEPQTYARLHARGCMPLPSGSSWRINLCVSCRSCVQVAAMPVCLFWAGHVLAKHIVSKDSGARSWFAFQSIQTIACTQHLVEGLWCFQRRLCSLLSCQPCLNGRVITSEEHVNDSSMSQLAFHTANSPQVQMYALRRLAS